MPVYSYKEHWREGVPHDKSSPGTVVFHLMRDEQHTGLSRIAKVDGVEDSCARRELVELVTELNNSRRPLELTAASDASLETEALRRNWVVAREGLFPDSELSPQAAGFAALHEAIILARHRWEKAWMNFDAERRAVLDKVVRDATDKLGSRDSAMLWLITEPLGAGEVSPLAALAAGDTDIYERLHGF